MKLVVLFVTVLALALAEDDVAGSSPRADTPAYESVMNNSPEGTFEGGEEGAGRLIGAGGEQAVAAQQETQANATQPESKCMCKGVGSNEDDAMVSAGWRKRASKCASEQGAVTTTTEDGEKCTVLKAPRCEEKEGRKKTDQCASKPKTRAQKDAKNKAREAKAKANEDAQDAADASTKSKCLSKFCADEDNLNRAKGSLSPPSSKECYDKCQKSHCLTLFDAGWNHWYECVQTCIGSCYRIVDAQSA